MTNINFENYEAFLLDYAEGNLSPELSAELMLFLAQHPELSVDLEGFSEFRLSADDLPGTSDFSHLKKSDAGLAEELDRHLFALVEGESDAATEAEIARILKLEPKLERHFRAFMQTRLSVDVDQILPNKEALHQSSEFESWWNEALVAEFDGALLADLKTRLDELSARNPHLARERSLMPYTRLEAENLVFPAKSKLYKTASPGRLIPLFVRYAAAAVLVFSIGMFAWYTNSSAPQMAMKVPSSTIDSLRIRQANVQPKPSTQGRPSEMQPKNLQEELIQPNPVSPVIPQLPERNLAQVEILQNIDVPVVEPFELGTAYITMRPDERMNLEEDILRASSPATAELSKSQRNLKIVRKFLKRNNIDIEEPIERIGQEGIDELSYQSIEKVSRGFIKVNREKENGANRVTGFSIGSLSYTRPSK